MDEAEDKVQRRSTRTMMVWGLVALAVIVVGGSVVIGLLRHNNHPSTQGLPAPIISAAVIPLYFPKPLTNSFHIVEDSIAINQSDDVVNFSLQNAAGAQLVVVEQTKPPIMEEVVKTKQFTTSIGPAYLADLNNRTAGFIVGSKTLIILSKVGDVDDAQLVQLMQHMSPAN